MSQKAVEVILMRQLASYLALPIFLVDPEGTLLFYNEPAEVILGRRFDETGKMPVGEWSTIFEPTEEESWRRIVEFDSAVLARVGHENLTDHVFRRIEDAFARRSAWYVYPDVMPSLQTLRASGVV